MLKNDRLSYGLITKVIHWITALLIVGLLSVGFFMAELPFSENKLAVYALHKSFGLLVLLLVFIRIAWHILSRRPKSLDTHAPWEKFLAHAAHLFLYVAMFALPLSGWIMSSAGDFTVKFFEIPVPDLVGKNESLFNLSKEVHEIFAIILVVVLGLHMAGAFKHHFIDRDATLQRMSSYKVGFSGGVVLVVLAGILMAPPVYFIVDDIVDSFRNVSEIKQEESVQNQGVVSEKNALVSDTARTGWVVDHDKSKIEFEVTQYGQGFTGNFSEFDGLIVFDPENLETAHAEIKIGIGSINTGSKDRDVQAIGKEWFDVSNFPHAQFSANKFQRIDEENFIAEGTLTIRGIMLPVTLPFTLKIEERDGMKWSKMKSKITLKRLDFGVGQGQWQSTDAIGDDVHVDIEIEGFQK